MALIICGGGAATLQACGPIMRMVHSYLHNRAEHKLRCKVDVWDFLHGAGRYVVQLRPRDSLLPALAPMQAARADAFRINKNPVPLLEDHISWRRNDVPDISAPETPRTAARLELVRKLLVDTPAEDGSWGQSEVSDAERALWDHFGITEDTAGGSATEEREAAQDIDKTATEECGARESSDEPDDREDGRLPPVSNELHWPAL